jgi:hypothetical protein
MGAAAMLLASREHYTEIADDPQSYFSSTILPILV